MRRMIKHIKINMVSYFFKKEVVYFFLEMEYIKPISLEFLTFFVEVL